ncbi:Holliday junction branch migration DNA helicase RuvB [Pseudoclavibacter soli]|uniref:Holliday junction branch migration DNA helicase RuvB n=1 Tax=Pseudoclavibacter soli TaxID=452623 RepID=UPI000414F065|nr:Holliday junction branch migration DNA helicase RuvB [Pseudoclavibacter soli]
MSGEHDATNQSATPSAASEVLHPGALDDDAGADQAFRPQSLDEFVGQRRVRDQLDLLLRAAKARSRAADHILLAGPPGLGKTTLAMIVAHELDRPLRLTSGPTITHAGDLAAILSSLTEGEVLFIDEIHRIAKPAAEMLYLAMEDFRVDVMVGKGPGATSIPLELAPFTLVGATTRSGVLPSPLRDRFGFTANMEFYPPAELEHLLQRSARLLELQLPQPAIAEIALRSRGTPRIANRLIRRVRDYLVVHPDHDPVDAVRATLALYEVDELGLDRLDREVLRVLITQFGGGPVGLGPLAMSVGEEAETLESVVEPFLVRSGLILRTPRGRVAAPGAWRHLGIAPSATGAEHSQPTLLDD